jgi:hypothetical protein
MNHPERFGQTFEKAGVQGANRPLQSRLRGQFSIKNVRS